MGEFVLFEWVLDVRLDRFDDFLRVDALVLWLMEDLILIVDFLLDFQLLLNHLSTADPLLGVSDGLSSSRLLEFLFL